MQKTRRIALVGASLAVALGSGYMMQTRSAERHGSAAEDAPKAITELAVATTPALDAVTMAPTAPALETPALEQFETVAATETVLPPLPPSAAALPEPVSASPEATPVVAAPAADIPDPVPALATAPELVPAPVQEADTCAVTFLATPAENALIDVTLLAPCAPSARVVLKHGGLAFTIRTSANGAIFATLPAMEPDGRVTVRFADGTSVEAAAAIDLAGIRRFGVQWVGGDAFQLQAYENGATFGAPGHVSAATPRPAAVGAPSSGGYITQLGDASVILPMLAEVYTWPATGTLVDVNVEAAVTEATCNREILGEVLESRDGLVASDEITLAMPACDAVGDFLVLNNLAPGTTLASAE